MPLPPDPENRGCTRMDANKALHIDFASLKLQPLPGTRPFPQNDMKRMTPAHWMGRTPGLALFSLALGIAMLSAAGAEEGKPAEPAKQTPPDVGNPDELKLPGITVYRKLRHVDVDATVCLSAGYLELIACTKDSKEHESIIAVDGKPSHMHAALLLLRATPGNPAMSKMIKEGQWLDLPPKGSEVDVFLAFKDAEGVMAERPISDFIVRASDEEIFRTDGQTGDKAAEEKGRFPTHTFLFAGSQLYKGDDGKARYLSDESGNVILLSSFGDELLFLPGKHSQENEALTWEIDPTHLPPLGTKVILRLKPKQVAEPAEKPEP